MGRLTPAARVKRNIAWMERHLFVPEGRMVGKPFRLTTEQKKWMRDIYGSATRMFILSMARKNGKTGFAAALTLLHLCGYEARPNSQLFSTALSRDQAAILFALAAKMVRMSPTLSEVVGIRDTIKQLYCEGLGTLYRALSADASTAYGLSPAFVVHDELGQVRGSRSELYEAMETAAAAQEEPLSIIISTQAPTDADLLSLLIDDALGSDDPRVKVRLYTAEKSLDPFARATIKKANPHFEKLMNQQEVMAQAESARRMKSRENSYRNLVLNQRVESRSPFIARSVWEECSATPRPLEKGVPVYMGLDLSQTTDLTALVMVAMEDGVWQVYPTFWLPGEGLEEKAHADRVPYDVWRDRGFLSTSPGRSIEYEFIAAHLRDVFDAYDVQCVAFDRWGMKHLIPWLEKAGFSAAEIEKFVPFGQGFQSMSPALKTTESLILNNKLAHGNHPVLNMCAANAVVQSDPAGNRKLAKDRAKGRIDGMIALSMALASATSERIVEKPKPTLHFL